MSAPSDLAIRAEVEILLRQAQSLPAQPDAYDQAVLRTGRVWDDAVTHIAWIIRECDAIIARLQSSPPVANDAALLGQVQAARSRAFEAMCRLNPDLAWFWTEAWQAGEREVDANDTSRQRTNRRSTEAFLAALDTRDRLLDASDRHADVRL
jgi:hypothetical protein